MQARSPSPMDGDLEKRGGGAREDSGVPPQSSLFFLMGSRGWVGLAVHVGWMLSVALLFWVYHVPRVPLLTSTPEMVRGRKITRVGCVRRIGSACLMR